MLNTLHIYSFYKVKITTSPPPPSQYYIKYIKILPTNPHDITQGLTDSGSCNGHGTCNCGVCSCDSGWLGDDW